MKMKKQADRRAATDHGDQSAGGEPAADADDAGVREAGRDGRGAGSRAERHRRRT